MLDELNLENALTEFAEKLAFIEQRDKQEFDRLAELVRKAIDCTNEQERFHRVLDAMPEDFALAFCKFILAVLLPSVNSKAPA